MDLRLPRRKEVSSPHMKCGGVAWRSTKRLKKRLGSTECGAGCGLLWRGADPESQNQE